MTIRRRVASASLAALLGLSMAGGLAACSDEDGDGAGTDEEVNEIDEGAEDAGEETSEEIEEGADEVDD